MSLKALNVQKLDSNGLSLETLPQALIYIPFMHSPETALSQKKAAAETLRDGPELTHLEIIQVLAETVGEILVDPSGGRPAEAGEGQLAKGGQRGNVLG